MPERPADPDELEPPMRRRVEDAPLPPVRAAPAESLLDLVIAARAFLLEHAGHPDARARRAALLAQMDRVLAEVQDFPR